MRVRWLSLKDREIFGDNTVIVDNTGQRRLREAYLIEEDKNIDQHQKPGNNRPAPLFSGAIIQRNHERSISFRETEPASPLLIFVPAIVAQRACNCQG